MDKKTQNVQEECEICQFQISYQTTQFSCPLILILWSSVSCIFLNRLCLKKGILLSLSKLLRTVSLQVGFFGVPYLPTDTVPWPFTS